MALQSPQSLCDAIVVHVTERMHTNHQSQDVALAANRVEAGNIEQLLLSMQAAIVRLETAQAATALAVKPFSSSTKHSYCWTHGVCGHSSVDCRSKAPGHQNAATEKNKMGGSVRIRVKT
jgi:hypothetical protein